MANARDMYRPPQNGVHLCGISSQETSDSEFYTVANFPCIDPRGVWESLREFAVPAEEADIVVDFFINVNAGAKVPHRAGAKVHHLSTGVGSGQGVREGDCLGSQLGTLRDKRRGGADQGV